MTLLRSPWISAGLASAPPRAAAAITLLFALGSAGCEVTECDGDDGSEGVCAESLTRFTAEPITPAALPYTLGTGLDIVGIYGEIAVVGGVAGEVGVTFEPFTYRGFTREDEAKEELDTQFDFSFEQAGGVIQVRTLRINGGDENLGADIIVYLPPEFDAELLVENESDGSLNPGDVDIDYVGDASSVQMRTDSLGDCELSGAPSVASTLADCDGEISITGVSDGLNVRSRGLEGNIFIDVAEVGPGAPADNPIASEDGDIELSFPALADFSVQMQSTADGFVDEGDLPAECRVDAAADTSKTVACGVEGAPNYRAEAGLDGVGPSNVLLGYH